MNIQIKAGNDHIYKIDLLSFGKAMITGSAISVLFKGTPTPSIVAWVLVWWASAIVRVFFKAAFMDILFVHYGKKPPKTLQKVFIPLAFAQFLSLGAVVSVFILYSVHPITPLKFFGWMALSFMLLGNQIRKNDELILL